MKLSKFTSKTQMLKYLQSMIKDIDMFDVSVLGEVLSVEKVSQSKTADELAELIYVTEKKFIHGTLMHRYQHLYSNISANNVGNTIQAIIDEALIHKGNLGEIVASEVLDCILHESRVQKGSDMTAKDGTKVEVKYVRMTSMKNGKGKNLSATIGSTSSRLDRKEGDLAIVMPWHDGKVYLSVLPEQIWRPLVSKQGQIQLTATNPKMKIVQSYWKEIHATAI
jgi:hypothetical protein